MNRFFYFFAVCSFLLISCSSEESSSMHNIDGTRLTRSKLTYNGGANVITNDIFYNGDRLSHVNTSDGHTINYFYTGELITRIEYTGSEGVEELQLMEYDDDQKLLERVQLQGNNGYKVIYTHNSDGTISVAAFTGDAVTQNTPTDLNKKVFFTDGIFSKIEDYKMIEGNLETLFTNYAFDTATPPYGSITGYDKLTFYDLGPPDIGHNLTSITYTNSVNSVIDVDEIINTYNANNFLSKAIHVDPGDNGGSPMIFEYFYE